MQRRTATIFGLLTGLMLCAFLYGCGATKDQQIIDGAGDLGAIGCLVAQAELSPEDMTKMTLAVDLATAFLADEQLTFATVATLFGQFMPPERVPYATASLMRLMNRLHIGEMEVLAPDSVARKALTEFLTNCRDVLSVNTVEAA